MSANMIRCIEVKSGKEKFMPEALTKDSKFMRKHGLEVQDIKALKKELTELDPELTEEETPLSTEVKKRGGKPKPETEEL